MQRTSGSPTRRSARRSRRRSARSTNDWENLYRAAGSADRVLLVEFKSEKLKPLTGKTLAEAAKLRGEDPVDTIMNLVLEDRSRVGTVYFMMSEDNIRKQIALPWISFGSDAASMAPEPPFTRSSAHPRAYGNFARLLGKYVRDEHVISLAEAVRKLSGQPATNLELDRRGFLKEGLFADVVVFDPATIADRATFEKPHQYAVGMKHVFVNGAQVLKDGEHTGAKPGRALWGPGKIASQGQGGRDGHRDGRCRKSRRCARGTSSSSGGACRRLRRQARISGRCFPTLS